jgi:hypothetical protein
MFLRTLERERPPTPSGSKSGVVPAKAAIAAEVVLPLARPVIVVVVPPSPKNTIQVEMVKGATNAIEIGGSVLSCRWTTTCSWGYFSLMLINNKQLEICVSMSVFTSAYTYVMFC